MATDTEAQTGAEPIDEHVHADHPSDFVYFKVFVLLFVVTAVEVLLYYRELPGVNLNNAALGILAIAKFVVVVGYFMHLKFDSRVLTRLFVGGLVLAVAVYIAYLLTMGVFIGENPVVPPTQQ